jgi:hypothetical protein
MIPRRRPFDFVNLVGDGLIRGATVVLPSAEVLRLLPHGLELGEQDLTPRGTHPVLFFFQDMYRAHMTIPTLLPNMTYNEQIVGVPFCYVTSPLHRRGAAIPGPFFYMARLFLDDFVPTIGGLLWWGFAKKLATILVTEDRIAVLGRKGETVLSLDFQPVGEFRPLSALPHFERVRRIMDQPLVSQLPLARGPWFACSGFDKKWDVAEARPLTTVVRIDRSYVPGLPCGRFPAVGRSEGIDQSVLGSFQIRVPWRQGLPYPP